ncbi:hypothetical protein SARC_03990 [Sphaeroforma arctica JP610]|uniref:Uncharacterized protein n=1 Tax=Sphaeroforma arctica JP610 TaxID=667725 RepID=A0A0L0G4N7_9EUKA|nr:hypothetical protein SARC_03990 [Sphaeroforma arctica JP610]KNC83766.1 hypothetical protein SARC_03990 [Sphaeroforma arctica JP610]|eukprot:XP_014157668.1 hypothetical protein SARC_03990 [Sphaeroforma arctica JP610]
MFNRRVLILWAVFLLVHHSALAYPVRRRQSTNPFATNPFTTTNFDPTFSNTNPFATTTQNTFDPATYNPNVFNPTSFNPTSFNPTVPVTGIVPVNTVQNVNIDLQNSNVNSDRGGVSSIGDSDITVNGGVGAGAGAAATAAFVSESG